MNEPQYLKLIVLRLSNVKGWADRGLQSITVQRSVLAEANGTCLQVWVQAPHLFSAQQLTAEAQTSRDNQLSARLSKNVQ